MHQNGEELLLARSPVFKRRYAHDGDLLLGCRIGCKFCYYRWISASRDYIGTGRLKRLASPEEMVEFLLNSKLFLPSDILILGARGDASMYPREVLEFLELISGDRSFRGNLVLALHRAPATRLVEEALGYENFRFGTTITPMGFKLQWTPVREDLQLLGLRRLLDAGVDPSKVSIEVGPLNSMNLQEGIKVLRELGSMGFKECIVRGVAFGTFGVDRDAELRRLIDMGFIEPKALREREDHEYYVVKNFLDAGVFERLQEEVPGIRLHRYTYTFYRDVWGVPIAGNRKNRVRVRCPARHSEKHVKRVVEEYGLEVEDVERRGDHYFVRLTSGQPATEDIAMTIGAELGEAIIFDRYRQTASLSDVKFYKERGLFYLYHFIGDVV